MAEEKHVLVVDDSPAVRELMMRQVESLGYAVRGAGDGLQALESIRAQRPDAVLCDLRMPKMDGLDLLAAARTEFPDLPMLVMSGAGLFGDAIAALKLGAWDYIEKPIPEPAVLEHALARALERADLLEQNRRYREHLEAANERLRSSLQRLAEDEEAGRQIQFRMLPENHLRFGPIEVSRDLVASEYLSGDFLDAFPIDARRFGFYLADVSGHGVPSALVTVLLHAFVQRTAADHATRGDEAILAPATLLERLNEQLLRENLGKHLTMFYGVVDLGDGSLTYANAGQFPWPLLWDGARTVELEQPGFPIGLQPRARYRAHRLALPDEFVLAVFSDGLLDVLPHKDLDAKRSFLRALFGRRGVSVERVREELRLDERVPLPDDVAVLLVQRGGA